MDVGSGQALEKEMLLRDAAAPRLIPFLRSAHFGLRDQGRKAGIIVERIEQRICFEL